MVFLLFESMSWIEDYFVDPFLNNSFYHHSIKTQVSNIRWWPIIPNSYQSTSRKWWRCQFNIITIRWRYWQSEQWVIVQSYQKQTRKWNRITILSEIRNKQITMSSICIIIFHCVSNNNFSHSLSFCFWINHLDWINSTLPKQNLKRIIVFPLYYLHGRTVQNSIENLSISIWNNHLHSTTWIWPTTKWMVYQSVNLSSIQFNILN